MVISELTFALELDVVNGDVAWEKGKKSDSRKIMVNAKENRFAWRRVTQSRAEKSFIELRVA